MFWYTKYLFNINKDKKPIFEKFIYKNDNFKYNFTEWNFINFWEYDFKSN